MADSIMKDFHKKYIRISPWWKFIRQEFRIVVTHAESTVITGFEYEDDKVSIDKFGLVKMKIGFQWGASGLTIDTKSSRRASCVHDALYHISNQGIFKGKTSDYTRKVADSLLFSICLDDGMFYYRAKTWYDVVRVAGGFTSWESGVK